MNRGLMYHSVLRLQKVCEMRHSHKPSINHFVHMLHLQNIFAVVDYIPHFLFCISPLQPTDYIKL
jgi:hypothetical protein